jgi:hypothetical protein
LLLLLLLLLLPGAAVLLRPRSLAISTRSCKRDTHDHHTINNLFMSWHLK